MKLTLDVENTTTKKDGKMHLDPFEPNNKLIMVGCLQDNGQHHLFNMDNGSPNHIQKLLDQATILIGHNIAYDLMWLWESGFKYDGPVFDTMLVEYILQRGMKETLSLMGHEVQIVNIADPSEIINSINKFRPDFVHINYDDWVGLYPYIQYPCACTTHFA